MQRLSEKFMRQEERSGYKIKGIRFGVKYKIKSVNRKRSQSGLESHITYIASRTDLCKKDQLNIKIIILYP